MKKTVLKGVLLTSLVFNSFPAMSLAEHVGGEKLEEGIYWQGPEDVSLPGASRTSNSKNSPFVRKTPSQRAGLSANEKEAVNQIEAYLNSQVDLKSRGLIEGQLDKAVINLAFDFGFDRDSKIFNLISGLVESSEMPQADWYNQLTNVSERNLAVFDQPTGKTITLKARYIDNGSTKTMVVHHGYRGSGDTMLDFARLFSDKGYNVLIPEARSHSTSGGKYISFGHYEKMDLNKWIEQEVAGRPKQEVVLFGVSMGAATTVLSQDKPHPNVKAYIEDCGYSSAYQQYKDTLHLLTQYLQYIPIVNLKDWSAKEDQLIMKLNETKVKPILKFDLYTVSPLKSAAKTGIPKLFIHGLADWFIPPIALTEMYQNAKGYKEELVVQGAGHAQAYFVDKDTYTNKVFNFLETVDNMTTENPIISEDVNLIKNSFFNVSAYNFTDWETSTNFMYGFNQQAMGRNNYNEFILKQSRWKDKVTATQLSDGIRFYTKDLINEGFVGQNVRMVAGQTYELSFNAQKTTGTRWTYPTAMYGMDGMKQEMPLKTNNPQPLKMTYRATQTKDVKVKVGAKLGYRSILDKDFSHTQITDLTLINTDRTPPAVPRMTDISWGRGSCVVRGSAEANTVILVKDSEGNILGQTLVNRAGAFSISLASRNGKVQHLANQDTKGNLSKTQAILFN